MLNFVLSQLSRTQIAQNLMGSITTTKKHVAQTLACLFAEANYSSLCALANQNIWAFIELIQRGVFEEVEMGVRKIGFRVCNCFGKWRRMYFRRPGHFKSHNQRRFGSNPVQDCRHLLSKVRFVVFCGLFSGYNY